MLNLAAALPIFVMAISWLLATLAVRDRTRALDFSDGRLGDVSWWAALGALAGGRLGYVLGHWTFFLPYPQDVLLTFWHGLSFYGGLIGALVAGAWYARRHGLAAWPLANAVAPALPLGVALARLGFLALGTLLPAASAAGPISSSGRAADLLEALLCLGLFVTTSHRAGRTKAAPLLLALAGYGLVRAMADLLRPEASGLWPLTDQSFALATALIGLLLLALPAARHPFAGEMAARRAGRNPL